MTSLITILTSMEALGIYAGLFELVGLWLVGSRRKLGFILSMIGNVFWVTFSLITHTAFGLIIVCTAAFILNARAYNKWRKQLR